MEKVEAQRWLAHVKELGVSPQVIVDRYTQTRDRYEEAMTALDYTGDVETARMLGRLFPEDRENVNILDVAAGTGLCAVEFRKLGFTTMTAFDPSSEMLDAAKAKNLYTEYICDILDDKTLDIEDDTYDAITMSSFCVDIMRNLPLKSLEEIIRITKPGGYVINTGFYATFTDEPESAEFRRKMKLLEAQGKWRQVEIKWFPEYLINRDGGVSVHQIL